MHDTRVLLERFLVGPDRSVAAAGALETALLLEFSGDERFEDLLDALAMSEHDRYCENGQRPRSARART